MPSSVLTGSISDQHLVPGDEAHEVARQDFASEDCPPAPVLLVDDRKEKLFAIKAVLEEMNLPVEMAMSGTEALRHLLREDFSVILLDLNMPGMDGLELAKLIRSRPRSEKTPIIFYTADAAVGQAKLEAAYALGAVDFMIAPVPPTVLRAKVAVFADFHRRLVNVRRLAGERERLLHAEAARAEAERASAAKDHFMAMLSHELRTPLSPVLNTVELLLGTKNPSAEIREGLEMIRRNVVLEARLIDDLLDLTRVSRGKVNLQMEQVLVRECVNNVLEICRPEMDEKQTLVKVLDEASNPSVRADAARLKQILWNLIRNAIKYTKTGSTISVTLSIKESSWLMIQVRDSGCGISPELLPGIFEAFRQGTHSTGGLGLGLAITRSLVELHGGKIEAQSEGIDRGATFSVRLPNAASTTSHLGAAPVPRIPTDKPAAPPRMTGSLLVVEDHADTRATLARLLKRRGYEVSTAVDVRSAVALTSVNFYDVILSDIGLPDGTGHEFISQVAVEQRSRSIALSGFGMEEDLARSVKSGFTKHLTKPVNPVELDHTIQQLLARHQH